MSDDRTPTGRLRSAEHRGQRLDIDLAAGEVASLRAAAKREGVPLRAWCRRVLVAEERRRAREADRAGAAEGVTHHAECWRQHHACAVAEVERLRARDRDGGGR